MPRDMVYQIPQGALSKMHFTASDGHEDFVRRIKCAHVRAFNEPDETQRKRDKQRLRRLLNEFKAFSAAARAMQTARLMPMSGSKNRPN